ncbi:uncharacterized protein LOC130731035 [Lotus japonicus]|uniref:uncharacterized protein LOC130731035 n=1 Tax=Lotus japonicus TaxID=34305 RepID=UPI00258FEEFB|nr:uncharacterized protein LOC130731035 [Lotus japonicus]
MSSIILMKSLSLVRKCRFLSAYGGRFPVRAYAAPAPTFEPYVAQSRYLGSTSISDEHPSFEPSSMKTFVEPSAFDSFKAHQAAHVIVMLHLKPSILGDLVFRNELTIPAEKSDLLNGLCCMSRYSLFPSDSVTKKDLRNRLCILVAGYVGEEMSFGPNFVTTRSKLDFKAGMNLAWYMVSEFAFGEFGPGSFSDRSCVSDQNLYSMEKAARHLLADAVRVARQCLIQHLSQFHSIAKAIGRGEVPTPENVDKLTSGC